jgi:hypothetical protein
MSSVARTKRFAITAKPPTTTKSARWSTSARAATSSQDREPASARSTARRSPPAWAERCCPRRRSSATGVSAGGVRAARFSRLSSAHSASLPDARSGLSVRVAICMDGTSDLLLSSMVPITRRAGTTRRREEVTADRVGRSGERGVGRRHCRRRKPGRRPRPPVSRRHQWKSRPGPPTHPQPRQPVPRRTSPPPTWPARNAPRSRALSARPRQGRAGATIEQVDGSSPVPGAGTEA